MVGDLVLKVGRAMVNGKETGARMYCDRRASALYVY